MKSATGTLDHILSQHEEIFIPDGEIHFFSVDDVTEHPAFFRRYGSEWAFQDYRRNFGTYRTRYSAFFEEASPQQKIGDDSTVYLASEKAPKRIAELIPNVRLIFLLRDPVARAYSQYWHSLQSGRATYCFENALQYGNSKLITRGFYRRQLERYLGYFSRDQITILIFQDFIQNMQARVNEVCKTLGVSGGLDLSTVDTTKQNASRAPRWPWLLARQNYLFRSKGQYKHFLPNLPSYEPSFFDRLLSTLNFRLRKLNLTNRSPPPMDRETRAFLEKLYAKENQGLSELIGIDVEQYWPYM
jgi:hypothetical protein